MKYKSIKIENYKAIKELEIDFKERTLIPFIGLNETGKSSILEAIFAFDSFNDDLNGSRHISKEYISNKYKVLAANPLITAKLEIEEETKKDIVKEIMKKFYNNCTDEEKENFNERFIQLLNEVCEENIITIERNLFTKKYKIKSNCLKYDIENKILNENDEDITDTIEKLTDNMINYIQYSIYIDDFNDRIPKEIQESDNWFLYIKEAFKATSEEYTIDLFKTTEEDKKKNILNDVSQKINYDVMETWNNILQNFIKKDEVERSKIKLEYQNELFRFIICDTTTGNERIFDVSDRSKGFQWFLNFVIKLKYNPNYRNKEEGALFLLDEPGSFLHSSGQKELLKKLKDLSKNNTILYCTHLENLIDISVINPKDIEIIKKDDEIRMENFSFSKDKKDNGSYTPILNSLKLSNFPLDFYDRNVIITEGISDFYFLKILIEKAKILDKNIVIIPGSGVKELENLLSLAIGLSNSYTLILDNDGAGKQAFDEYEKKFGLVESKKWIKHDINKEIKVLEDYYSEEMKGILNNYTKDTYKDKYKVAIGNFFYEAKKDDLNAFINLVKNDKNIEILVKKINGKLKSKTK